MSTAVALETLYTRWNDLVFRDFSLLAQQLGGVSSDKVNAVLATTLQQTDAKTMMSWLRLIIALHFQLGKLAEFTLNDRTFLTLLNIVERSVQKQPSGGSINTAVPQLLADLCVILLSLNTATAASTVGIENQLCALYIVASPNQQRAMLPLVHRSFYANPSSALSADTFHAMIRRQGLDGSFHEFLRLYALVHAAPGVLDEFTTVELLSTSPVGPKPLFGAPSVALGLDGGKCSNNRGDAGSKGSAQPFFTALHMLESPTAAQVHHCYVVSAYANAFRRAARLRRTSEASLSSSESSSEPSSPVPPRLLSLTACEKLAHYLHDIFFQLLNLINGKKCSLYCSKKGLGLTFIEGVISECLYVSKQLCLMHPGTDMARELAAEVTNFLYCAMHTERSAAVKPPTTEIPELLDGDVVITYVAGGNSTDRKLHSTAPASGLSASLPGGSAVGDPLFSPDIMIKCLEFQIAIAPPDEVLNFFDDIFGTRMWDAYLEHHESFALELCLALERNAAHLTEILPPLAPRVLWLLSQQPHILFPVVKRLIQPMLSPATGLDVFFRIVFLPLICFSNHYAPPSGEGNDDFDGSDFGDDEYLTSATTANLGLEHNFYRELWNSITDWHVDTKYETTRFTELCMNRNKKFALWDALHRSMGSFDGRMTIAFRLIRPLLTEYFRALDHLPSQIFSAIRTAYFFLVSPQEQRHVVTDYLLEMGRWIAEMRPALVVQSTSSLIDALQQDFVPAPKRSWQLQRWAAMVAATSLSLLPEDDAVVREAAAYFEVLHVSIWELVALASTVVTIQYQASLAPTGRTIRDVSSAHYKNSIPSLHFAHSGLAVSSLSDTLSSSTPYDGGLAADYIPEARLALNKNVSWDDAQPVWAAPNGPRSQDMCGLVFTEHMHSLVIALAAFSQICPNVKERGIICLANLIRTLLKSKHSGSQLATNAAIYLKLLRFPTMCGLGTMPLHALLGLQVLRDTLRPTTVFTSDE